MVGYKYHELKGERTSAAFLCGILNLAKESPLIKGGGIRRNTHIHPYSIGNSVFFVDFLYLVRYTKTL